MGCFMQCPRTVISLIALLAFSGCASSGARMDSGFSYQSFPVAKGTAFAAARTLL